MDAHFAADESRLKAVRKKCGLTQDALAKASGVPVNTIRAYERKSKDLNKAKADIIMRLTRALRCEISDLLGILCLCRVSDIIFKILPSGKSLPTIGI